MRASDDLSKIFAALGDPTRRALLARPADGEVSVTDLAEPFDMTMGAVTKHLAILQEAGLIERTRRARFRPCRLRPDALGVAEAEAGLGWAGSAAITRPVLTALQPI